MIDSAERNEEPVVDLHVENFLGRALGFADDSPPENQLECARTANNQIVADQRVAEPAGVARTSNTIMRKAPVCHIDSFRRYPNVRSYWSNTVQVSVHA